MAKAEGKGMARYLSDFVTGRSMGADDKVVALVVVPAGDALRNAARDPSLPQEHYVPISLPLRGILDDEGNFVPDPNQLAMTHLLHTARLPSWEAICGTLKNNGVALELSHPNPEIAARTGMRRTTYPALAVMHQDTFVALTNTVTLEDDPADAVARAAAIVMDASERYTVDDELDMMEIARLGKPHEEEHVLKSGRSADVPKVSGIFSSTAPWTMSVYAKHAIVQFHKRSHETDGAALRQTFTLLSEYQHLIAGMMALNRYFVPSTYARHDNSLDTVDFQLSSIDAVIGRVLAMGEYGPEYANDTGMRLADLA